MSKTKVGIGGLALLLALTCSGNGLALAQSGEPYSDRVVPRATLPSPPLKLSRTKMVVGSNTVALSTTPVVVFTPVKLKCQNSAASCTLRIEISSQFNTLTTGAAQMRVTVSGTTVAPTGTVNASTNREGLSATHTMTFVADVASGNVATATAQFATTTGTGNAGFRTMTVSLFTP